MDSIKTLLKDKRFLRKTIVITIPIALQNLLNNLLNLIDVLMIGKIDQTSIAAVGLANRVFFVFILLTFGICSGSAILASQYWGKRETYNIKRVLYISLFIGILGSLIFVIPSVIFPEKVMAIFTPDKKMIKIGATYLAIVSISYPMTAIANAYMSVLRSMNSVKPSVIVTLIAILTNVVFNYLLIFGNFGFPELGVAGAALATLLARAMECILILIYVYTRKLGKSDIASFIRSKADQVKKGMPKPTIFERNFLEKYMHTATPVILNEFIWGLGVTMYALVYGRMSENATAAITITQTVEQLVLVLFMGICSAAAVVLGNELGANNMDRAERYAKNYISLLVLLSIAFSFMTILFRWQIISIFNVTEEVANYINLCLIIFSLYMPIKMLNTLIIIAILRSGGDTRYCLLLDISSVWFIGIPMAVLGGLILKFPIYIVYAMILMEEAYKFIMSFYRYKKKKWLRNIVE
ncbi:MAG TPA: MATE family efflux transporter [Clostridiales bacterium]|nr:MATE family efflux transporter [Clostridiales bacterium]